jgi:endoglucanase
MDEVGLLITHITRQGLLLFSSIGMEGTVLHGRKVFVGDRAIPGVIGTKVWHHVEEQERDAPIKNENLYIDIGAKDRTDAGALVSLGDCVVLDGPFALWKTKDCRTCP